MSTKDDLSKFNIVWRASPGPQTHLIQCPVFETFYGGARGGGKTDGVLGEWALHAQQYGAEAIGLCVRRKRVELVEMIERSKVLYGQVGADYSKMESMWTFPNGARLRFAYLETDSDADNYQGHAYTRIYVEEIGTFESPAGIFKLMATLGRNPKVPSRFIPTGNPGGVGHGWVKARYVDPDPKGYRIIQSEFPDDRTGGVIIKERMYIPAKVADNPYTNTPSYIGNLHMSGGEQLVKAWLHGDWGVIAGAFFPEFDERRHVIKSFTPPKHWTRFMAMDWGFATPFSIGWYCVVPDQFDIHREIEARHWVRTDEQLLSPTLPKGSVIKYREWYGSQWRENILNGVPNAQNANPNVGLRLTAREVAAGIRLREANEPKSPNGRPRISWRVADPAMFKHDNGPSLAEQFSLKPNYINLTEADNSRVKKGGNIGGWDAVRNRLKGGSEGISTLYFMDNCIDSIRTLPALQHDTKRPEDLDTDGEDHAPDEIRYACMSRPYSRVQDTAVRGYIKQHNNDSLGIDIDDDIFEVHQRKWGAQLDKGRIRYE